MLSPAVIIFLNRIRNDPNIIGNPFGVALRKVREGEQVLRVDKETKLLNGKPFYQAGEGVTQLNIL